MPHGHAARTHTDPIGSHDHCFVPLGKEQDALKALDTLARIRAVDDGMSSLGKGL